MSKPAIPVVICGNAALIQIGGRVPPDRLGDCGKPADDPRVIRIRGSLRGEKFAEVFFHEMLHLAMWSLDEEHVTEIARGLAEALQHPEIWERIHED